MSEEFMELSKNRAVFARTAALALLVALFVATFAAISARAQTDDAKGPLTESDVLALQKKFQDAGIHPDMPTLSALIADNATFIHDSGLVQTKAQFINSITSGQMKALSYKMKDAKVVFFRGGAIVLAVDDLTVAPPRNAPSGAARLLHLRISTVWLRKLDGWQIILNQGTSLEPAKDASSASH
jgi:hypothetical protein